MLLLLLLAPTAAVAASAERCETYIRLASAKTGVPAELLRAIGRVESGVGEAGRPWPWTVRDAGAHYFRDRTSAVRYASARIAEGRSNIDLGCMQINWRWHGAAFRGPDHALDPAVNVLYAALYLGQLYREAGSWSGAVSAYHSRDPERASRYRCRVVEELWPERRAVDCLR